MDANLYLLPHNKDRTRFVDRSRSRAALMAAEEIGETFNIEFIATLSPKGNEEKKCTYTLFFYKNIFYKNIEAEIYEILRIF